MYTMFDSNINSSSFDVTEDKCISFPGPGDTIAMAENPLFEYFGGSGYSTQHQSHKIDSDFSQFKEKHNRNYQDKKEEAQRKVHFHHNHRYSSAALMCRSTKFYTFPGYTDIFNL